MKYCTNCGKKLYESTKFCTGCGQKTTGTKKDNEAPKVIKKETTKKNIDKTQTTEVKKPSKKKTISKWILFYFLVNIPLYIVNTGNDEILGILIFSTIVIIELLIYLISKKKDKPFSIVLKIIVILQSLLAVLGIVKRLEFIGPDYSLLAIVSLTILIFMNLKMIFKGNK